MLLSHKGAVVGALGVPAHPWACVCVSEGGNIHSGISGSVFIQVLEGKRGFMGPTAGRLEPQGFPGLQENKSSGTGRVEALLKERMAQGSFSSNPRHLWNPSFLSR